VRTRILEDCTVPVYGRLKPQRITLPYSADSLEVSVMKVLELRSRIDFGIITIKDEEFKALISRFEPWEIIDGARHRYVFSRVLLNFA
jgi:hypothetical protein